MNPHAAAAASLAEVRDRIVEHIRQSGRVAGERIETERALQDMLGVSRTATLIMRGEYDGIASMQDLLEYFAALANANKAFAVMPGIAHASFQQKNYLFVYHTLLSFFTQPVLVYTGVQ